VQEESTTANNSCSYTHGSVMDKDNEKDKAKVKMKN
jgi:hypothetical protein